MEQEPQFDAAAEALVRQAIESCVDTIPAINWHREFTRSQEDLEELKLENHLLRSQSASWQWQAHTTGKQVVQLTNWLIFAAIGCAAMAFVICAGWAH